MEIRNKLAGILKDYRGESIEVSDETTFDQLGFDSLDKVELLMKIEEDFGIMFNDDLQVETIGQLVEKIAALKK